MLTPGGILYLALKASIPSGAFTKLANLLIQERKDPKAIM